MVACAPSSPLPPTAPSDTPNGGTCTSTPPAMSWAWEYQASSREIAISPPTQDHACPCVFAQCYQKCCTKHMRIRLACWPWIQHSCAALLLPVARLTPSSSICTNLVKAAELSEVTTKPPSKMEPCDKRPKSGLDAPSVDRSICRVPPRRWTMYSTRSSETSLNGWTPSVWHRSPLRFDDRISPSEKGNIGGIFVKPPLRFDTC